MHSLPRQEILVTPIAQQRALLKACGRAGIIHATVIRQDEPTEDQSSIYMIFERLNTGGVNLQPQEIRVALYHGELVRVLRTLNDQSA
jgi:hypothetical protein